MDKVSVIIPSYNCAKYICDAVDSILRQTYSNYEIIVVDDGSTDNTKEIISSYGGVIKYIYQDNKGPNAARNKGIACSDGEYIAFLDADDVWLPEKLTKQMELLVANRNLGLVGCGFIKVDKVFRIIQTVQGACYSCRESLRNDLSIKSIASGSASGIVIPREVFDKVGLFDESMTGSEDRDMWFRIVNQYDAKFVKEPCVKIRIHESNAHKNIPMMMANQLKFIKKHKVSIYFRLRCKAYSYVYLDAAREYYVCGHKLSALMCIVLSIIWYPARIYRDDDKYCLLVKSMLPDCIVVMVKRFAHIITVMLDIIHKKGLGSWFPEYCFQNVNLFKAPRSKKLKHILFCFVDHYEPFVGGVNFSRASARVNAWVSGYGKMADKHKDSDGKVPQHTWFYPPHQDHVFLSNLVQLCKSGYGEIEMHLHHNHMQPFPEIPGSLRAKILQCIEDYSKHGIFCLPDGTKRFAFIHGDWSLDNSRGSTICGVNNEISILKECGCFADFTFPSLGDAQPAMINKIYYASDDSKRPKSYNRGKEISWNRNTSGDLMMIPGILGLRWQSRTHRFMPSIEASNIDKSDFPFPARIDYWIRNAITIRGRSDWFFIKIHTHGARDVDFKYIFGDIADEMYEYLENKYNDGKNYSLHYVTAREMYNIAKAAEAGKSGNPGQYRDFEIKKYIYLNQNST